MGKGTPVAPKAPATLQEKSEAARQLANNFIERFGTTIDPYVLALAGHMIAAAATLTGSKRGREAHMQASGEIYDQMSEALRMQMEKDGIKVEESKP